MKQLITVHTGGYLGGAFFIGHYPKLKVPLRYYGRG